MFLVVPLYYGHRLVIGLQIKTNKFCLQERPTNMKYSTMKQHYLTCLIFSVSHQYEGKM